MRKAIARGSRLTGRDLAAERVRQSLRAADVAAVMKVSRQRVTTIEGQHLVAPELARRYFRALETAVRQNGAAPPKSAGADR